MGLALPPSASRPPSLKLWRASSFAPHLKGGRGGQNSFLARVTLAGAIFAICLALYLTGGRYVGSGDTRPSELLPISILEERNLNLNEFRKEGQDAYYLLEHKGNFYSAYSPVPALLNTLTFAAASLGGVNLQKNRKFLSLITSALLAAGAVALLFLILEELGAGTRWALVGAAMFAFGTTAWSVASRGLWQHGPAILFLHAGVFALLRGGLLPGGVLLGLCVASRTQCALLVGPLVALKFFELWASDRNKSAAFAGSFALPLLLLEYYFCAVLGRPFYFFQGGVHGVSGFGGDMLTGLAGLLFNPSRGLFIFSPFLLLGAYSAIRNFRNQPRELNALLIGSLALLLLTSKWEVWWGGHSFGYRIVCEVASPLIISLILHLKRGAGRFTAIVTAAAFLWSLAVHGMGAYLYPCGWNDKPEPINAASKRLWSVQNSEITACAKKAWRRW